MRKLNHPHGAVAAMLAANADPDKPFGGYAGELSAPGKAEHKSPHPNR